MVVVVVAAEGEILCSGMWGVECKPTVCIPVGHLTDSLPVYIDDISLWCTVLLA